jgi:tRNA threonylcarbamoyl adenosine modification protein YeaZ
MTEPLGGGYQLALHTSSSQLGLALGQGGQLIRQQTWELGRQLANRLALCLGEFLSPQSWADLDYLVVAQGPGSFTSIRLGLVTARVLAQQLCLPLFTYSSLQTFAQFHFSTAEEGAPLAISQEATQGRVYGGIYQLQQGLVYPSSHSPREDQLWELAAWQAQLQALPPTTHCQQAPEALGYTVGALLTLAAHAWQKGDRPPWQQAVPFYHHALS